MRKIATTRDEKGEIIKIETDKGIIECEHKFEPKHGYHVFRELTTNHLYMAQKLEKCVVLVKERYENK